MTQTEETIQTLKYVMNARCADRGERDALAVAIECVRRMAEMKKTPLEQGTLANMVCRDHGLTEHRLYGYAFFCDKCLKELSDSKSSIAAAQPPEPDAGPTPTPPPGDPLARTCPVGNG